MLGEVIFKALTKIGRTCPPPSHGNACKAFVADISPSCLTNSCERPPKTSDELFVRNRDDLETGAGRSFDRICETDQATQKINHQWRNIGALDVAPTALEIFCGTSLCRSNHAE